MKRLLIVCSVVLFGCTPSVTNPVAPAKAHRGDVETANVVVPKPSTPKPSTPKPVAKKPVAKKSVETTAPSPVVEPKPVVPKPTFAKTYNDINLTCGDKARFTAVSLTNTQFVFTVTNLTAKKIFRIEPLMEPSVAVFDDGGNRYKVSKLQPDTKQLVIKPGETKSISVDIDVTPPETIQLLVVPIRSWLLYDVCGEFIQGDTYARPQLDVSISPITFTLPLK